MMVVYNKGSLFDAPSGVLAHACNAMGVWGSGIAVEFKKRFPESFKEYQEWCTTGEFYGGDPRGFTLLTTYENNYNIGCMVTSLGYGAAKDSKESILRYSEYAIDHLLSQLSSYGINEVNSNKFNSGYFNVPWEETEELLKDVLKAYPEITWNIWVPDETQE